MITAAQRELPGPGIYENIPAAEYHSWPYCSASRLGQMTRSPAHCQHAMDHPETTEALIFGAAFHRYLLEPLNFRSDFVFAEQCSASKKNGDQCENPGVGYDGEEWFCGVHSKDRDLCGDVGIVPISMQKPLFDMTHCVLCNQAANLLIEAPGRVELSFVWDDPASGTRCKGRADKIVTVAGRRICVDLKTTEDASLDAFGRSILKYGYYRQGAMYLEGLAQLGEPCDAFMMIPVEKTPPHGVQVFDLDQEAMELGRREIGPLIAKFGECQRTGIWPAYSDRIETINLPAWKLKELTYSYQEQTL